MADYRSARPGYPRELFDRLEEVGFLRPELTVADLGAGTGLLTCDLLERVAAVIAVEPEARMRAEADALLGHLPNYRSLSAPAESVPLPDASVDRLVAAQAFHWFDPQALREESRRLLRPGGQVAWIWNEREAADPLQQELEALFDTFGGARRQAFQAHDSAAKLAVYFAGVDPAARRTLEVPWSHPLDLAGLTSLAFSRSYMPLRESREAQAVEQAIRECFERHARDGAVEMKYRAVAYLGPRME